MASSDRRGDRLVVAAIDVGTTFSGYAFSMRSDFESNPLQIRTNDWSAEGVHSSEMKAPSVLLLNPDLSFNSFGYRAQYTYSDLLEDDSDNAAKHFYVKNFKMQLHNRVCSQTLLELKKLCPQYFYAQGCPSLNITVLNSISMRHASCFLCFAINTSCFLKGV